MDAVGRPALPGGLAAAGKTAIEDRRRSLPTSPLRIQAPRITFAMGTFRTDVALTFDDVLLVPRHSTVHPATSPSPAASPARSRSTSPLVSAAMDTVTERRWRWRWRARAGSGVIHKNMPIDRQAAEVDRVKRSESGMILNPITSAPTPRCAKPTT